MKRFVILVSVLLFVSFGLMTVFAQTPVSPSRLVPEPNQPTIGANVDPNKTTTTTEAKSEAETLADILADPNKIEATIQTFEDLQNGLDGLDKKSGDETRQWLQPETASRIPLAREVHERIMAELMFVRKLADEEGAKKTTAAIDGLLLNRQKRYDELSEKLQERELRRERGTRSRYPTDQRSSQERRPRSRMSEEQQDQDTQEQYPSRTRSRRR